MYDKVLKAVKQQAESGHYSDAAMRKTIQLCDKALAHHLDIVLTIRAIRNELRKAYEQRSSSRMKVDP